MKLTKLQLTGFRNLSPTTITASEAFNLFFGENGAGKTSVLEAINFLSLGKSFRTSQAQHLIQENHDSFLLYCELINDGEEEHTIIGIEKHRHGGKSIKLNGEKLQSIAPLAKTLPIQMITTDSYRYFLDGPKTRRQFLHAGLFHVKQSFFPQWQAFQKILKQRNAALKAKRPRNEVFIWNQPLADCNNLLAIEQKTYAQALEPILHELIEQLLEGYTLSLKPYSGWDEDTDFLSTLESCYPKDHALGYTTVGIQRSDFQLYLNEVPAHEMLSQGQQKLAAYAIHLAQGVYQKKMTGVSPIYLIDDMPSELDPHKQQLVADILKGLAAQVFLTGIEEAALSSLTESVQHKLFQVKQGDILTQSS